MPITIKTNKAHIGKKMAVDRVKVDDADMVVCKITLAFDATREQAAEIAGIPLASLMSLYNESGTPVQHASILLTKRELLVKGRIARHIAQDQQEDLVEPNKKPPELQLPKALAKDMRFVLEPMKAGFRGSIMWKAAGDEVEDIKALLATDAEIALTFEDPKVELRAQGGDVQPEIRRITEVGHSASDLKDGEAPTGKPARKRRAAAGKDAAAGAGAEDMADADAQLLEKVRDFTLSQESINASQLQEAFNIGANRAMLLMAALEEQGLLEQPDAKGWSKVKHPEAPAGIGPRFANDLAAAKRRGAGRKPRTGRTH